MPATAHAAAATTAASRKISEEPCMHWPHRPATAPAAAAAPTPLLAFFFFRGVSRRSPANRTAPNTPTHGDRLLSSKIVPRLRALLVWLFAMVPLTVSRDDGPAHLIDGGALLAQLSAGGWTASCACYYGGFLFGWFLPPVPVQYLAASNQSRTNLFLFACAPTHPPTQQSVCLANERDGVGGRRSNARS